MTTDIERELRELFRDKAGEAPVSTLGTSGAAPQQVLRRGRLHQAGTVLGSAVVVVALIVGSVAGLTRILGEGEDDRDIGDGGYEVFQRGATIEAFNVGSPSDWFLVNEWPLSMLIAVEGSGGSSSACFAVPGGAVQECADTPGVETSSPLPVPHGLPMFQLSNIDLGLAANACADGLTTDAAVLYVALDYDAAIAGIADPSIQEFPPGIGLPPQGDGPCGRGRYAYFTVNGERFFSWIGVGSDASDEDRETVETSYEMMSAIPDWTPTPPNETTPAYVIAGGWSEAGEDWRLELRPSDRNVAISLIGEAPTASDGFSVPDHPIDWCCKDSPMGVLFGALQKGATGVEFRSTEKEAIAGTILPLPPTLPYDFDLFFIEGTEGLPGNIVALGLEERQTPPAAVGPRGDTVELSGQLLGQDWSVRFIGRFSEETACMNSRIADVNGELCPRGLETSLAGDQPSLHSWVTDHLTVFAGSVPLDVVEIRFVSDDDAIVPTQVRCAIGPLGWTEPDRKVCAIAFPPVGSGTLEYLNAEGNTLFEEGIGWGSAQPEVTSEWAISEGTICGDRWSLARVRSEQGFGVALWLSDGHMVSEGASVLGSDPLPTHRVPIYGCPDPADTPSAPESIIFGLVSRRADAVWVFTEGGEVLEASLATGSGDGPFVFWAMLDDASPAGEIVALDDCEVIGRGPFSTGQEPVPSPAPSVDTAECVPAP